VSQLCRGREVEPGGLARMMVRFQEAGCSNVNLVSPTHQTPVVLESVRLARSMGLTLPLVVNSGGYESVECLEMWRGLDCIYLVDLKYGDNASGRLFSGVMDYWDRAREALRRLFETAGPLVLDGRGAAVKGLMVRHLVLPGMRSNPFSALEFLAGLSTGIPVSIMSQYNPAFYTGGIEDMRRTLTRPEYEVVLERALDLGFETVYAQNMDSFLSYNPDFDDRRPFSDLARIA
jgi:putative pyruvate formate lyase activating enzyme